MLDTYVKRRGNDTPASYIYSLYSPHISSSLWTLYQVRRKVSLSYPSLSLLLLFRRREGLISFYILLRDLRYYSKLI
jgi:hypothetical protein